MLGPQMNQSMAVATDTHVLPSFLPVPGFGVLPVNAFVIKSREPVLVDTGLAVLHEDFMQTLGSILDPKDLRWIWITHADADHVGNLRAVLEAAPQARIVTTFIGMGKLNLRQIPLDRVFLLNPGQELDVGDRKLAALAPPIYDAPETTGVYDKRSNALFSADCFGALLQGPAEHAGEIPGDQLQQGMVAWSSVDAPWLTSVRPENFLANLSAVERLKPSVVLSSHLPPAHGMMGGLLENLTGALKAPAFVGPDQAALEAMMSAA